MNSELPDLSILRRCWPKYTQTATNHVVEVAGIRIGAKHPIVISGPCAVESKEHTLAIAKQIRAMGGTLLRGGVYKPRTSPQSFQGLGEKGLEILAEVREETGVGIVTEVMDPRLVEMVAGYADMLQLGSRSMYNYPLLKEVGQTQVPVLLKRGWSATLEEWLCSAEYIAQGGNRNIVLCERGIRASCHWSYSRNILDLNVIEPLRLATPLPVLVDPSHATGTWTLVETMSRAALATGAHGLLVEAHGDVLTRDELRCDGQQGVPPDVLRSIIEHASQIEIPVITDSAA